MVRLRRVSSAMPGWRRIRRGRGFSYVDADGTPLDELDVVRVKELVIPPAWTDVWICPLPNGHLQAVGTDAAGRRQYLYHPGWRVRRDIEKYHLMEEFAASLIKRRRRARLDMGDDSEDGLGKTRVVAATFSLLDLGMFRIGNDRYVEENGSHGLTTLERSHVTIDGRGVEFCYVAKSGQQVEVTVRDARVVEVLTQLRERREGGDRLLGYRQDGQWRDLTSDDVNEYVRERLEGDFTAKAFRTWRANVVAAWCLARSAQEHGPQPTKTARKKAVAAAMREVSEHLGNTPSVAKASYVDPRVIDLYEDGTTVRGDFRAVRPGAPVNRTLEKAVLKMIRNAPD